MNDMNVDSPFKRFLELVSLWGRTCNKPSLGQFILDRASTAEALPHFSLENPEGICFLTCVADNTVNTGMSTKISFDGKCFEILLITPLPILLKIPLNSLDGFYISLRLDGIGYLAAARPKDPQMFGTFSPGTVHDKRTTPPPTGHQHIS